MQLLKKKDGLPNQRFYDNPEIIALFDTVRTWLTRNCKKYWQNDPMTNKSLATLCYQLLQYQEETFGKTVVSYCALLTI